METENKSRGDKLFNSKSKRIMYLIQQFSQSEEKIICAKMDRKIFLISVEDWEANVKIKEVENVL